MFVRILIADDYELVRQGLRAMLQNQSDLQVIGEAEDGQRCVKLAAELRPDLIIMDVTMPHLNGIEATRQIHATNDAIRILAVSMHAERKYITGMLTAGASGYLFKDSRLDELLLAIRAVMRGETYLSPRLAGALLDDSASFGSATFCRNLSPRERQVLQMVAEGKNTKEIAYQLHLSTKTVEGHRRQVMEKLHLYSVAELTRYALREGVTC